MEQPQAVEPYPMPTGINISVVEVQDKNQPRWVRVAITSGTGVFVFFVPPDAGLQVAEMLAGFCQQAKTGIDIVTDLRVAKMARKGQG